MVKNIVMLCVSLLLLMFLVSNKVSALKDNTQEYCVDDFENFEKTAIKSKEFKINDNKISTRNRIKQLINDQKQILELENYSDESLSEFINVLINAQKLKRESIEFEKIHLNKINDLIL